MGEVFNSRRKEEQGSYAKRYVDDDDLLLGEGEHETVDVSFHLRCRGQQACRLVPAAELVHPGGYQHSDGSNRRYRHNGVCKAEHLFAEK